MKTGHTSLHNHNYIGDVKFCVALTNVQKEITSVGNEVKQN